MKTKKILSLLTASCMIAGTLAGCGGSASSSGSADAATTDATSTDNTETYHAVVAYLVNKDAADTDMVEEKLNELSMAQINTEITLMPMTWSTWSTQIQLMLAGGEQLDLFPMMMSQAATFIDAQYVEDISPYIEKDGPYLVENVGLDDIWCCSVGDFLWGVPTMKERANPTAMLVRTDLLEEAGIDVSQVKTFEDMTDVFAKVQALHPDMTMYGGGSTATPAAMTNLVDSLGDRYGVLEDEGQTTTVTNYFESDLFKRLVKLAREWYEAGYISKDMATSTDAGSALIKAGNLFAYSAYWKPDSKPAADAATGMDMTIIPMEENTLTTWMTGSLGYAVGSTSADPERAVQVLNWICETEEANDLLNWGVEGVHWVEQEDGTINYPDGVTADSCGYHQDIGYALPNQFNSHVWDGNEVGIWDEYQDFRDNAVKSKAYGFVPDLSGCVDEVAAVTEVYNEYMATLCTGSVDPDTTLDEFNAALYNAGLQTIIDTKQEQLDAWLAEQQQ